MASYPWFIAKRYLFSRERKALVSMITIISVIGVAVGVAALIVVIGVMDGADKLLFGKISDLWPHIRITSVEGVQRDEDLIKRIQAHPEVLKVEYVLEKQAFIQAGSGVEAPKQGIRLIAQDELGSDNLYKIPNIRTGEPIRIGEREILLGGPLAVNLQAFQGKPVQLISSAPVKTALYPVLKSTRMKVMGYFNTGFYEFDANVAFITTQDMRRLYPTMEGYDYIHVKLKDPWRADVVKDELKLEGYRVSTWVDENATFFGALKLEKFGLFIILMLIIVVAALNIIGTLILMVIEKTREIGILKAIGASERAIARIFLIDGMLIGLVGTGVGLAIGVAMCMAIPLIKFDMPAAVYNFDSLPVEIRIPTVLAIVACSMIVCTLAALFPARQAAKLNPVEALRYD